MPASADWHERFARVPNSWTAALVRFELTAAQLRVALYVVARTWGEHGHRLTPGRFGRSHVRISSQEIAAALGLEQGYVRRALATLYERQVLLRHHPARGRKPASIGPNPLLHLATEAGGDRGPGTLSLDDALATCSPALALVARRNAGQRGRGEAYPCRHAHGKGSELRTVAYPCRHAHGKPPQA